jgi:flagellar assembly protein FliH
MSLSNIIRKGGEPQPLFNLEPLENERPSREPDVFRAVRLGWDEPEEVEVEEEEEEELPPPPPCILEEEAHRLCELARAEGEQEGRKAAEAELAKANEIFGQALLAIGTLRGQLMHEAEEDLLKLAVKIAGKIVLRELATEPGVLAGLVRGAVELASDGGEVVVRLNAEDHAVVTRSREFKELLSDNRSVVLKADPAIQHAGCLVETLKGNIDAGLDAQLEEILRELVEEKTARREKPGND